MEAHRHFGGKVGSGRSGQAFTSRGGSVLVALISAVLAGVLIYLFVSHYHNKTIVAGPTTGTVFVATHYIAVGTPESVIAAQDMLKSEVVPLTQELAGAITDPSVIAGEVASASVVVGQQLTTGDFSRANVTLGSYLTGDHRAAAVAIDSAHGLTSYLNRGDTVDVVAQGNKGSFDLFQNIVVLGNQGGNVVLDLTDKQTLLLANAIQRKLTLWLTLRPVTGAKNSIPNGYMVKL